MIKYFIHGNEVRGYQCVAGIYKYISFYDIVSHLFLLKTYNGFFSRKDMIKCYKAKTHHTAQLIKELILDNKIKISSGGSGNRYDLIIELI
jgi:hypothetical protein